MPERKFPANPKKILQKLYWDRKLRLHPNWRGVARFRPGHYYSPLLDIEALGPGDSTLPFDGEEWWEHVEVRRAEQRAYYEDLLNGFPPIPFPQDKTSPYRYFAANDFFGLGDAFTLAGVIRKERPRRLIEIGSGFSSAVTLDTLEQSGIACAVTFVEPDPTTLLSLFSQKDRASATVIAKRVQEVPLSTFDQLDSRDILFIDSSHVCKIGSDVAFILLRILPRLKSGVLVHFHDVFYPFTYPSSWIREGRAWNEALFLRAFLLQGSMFQIVAFNAYAAHCFPELFRERFPAFLEAPGASLWIAKK